MAKQVQECLGYFEEDTECLGDPKAEKKSNQLPCADLEDCKTVKAVAGHRGVKPEELLSEYSLDRIREIYEQELEGKGKKAKAKPEPKSKSKAKPEPKSKSKAKPEPKSKPATKAKAKAKPEPEEKKPKGKTRKPGVGRELTLERYLRKAKRMLQPNIRSKYGVKVRNDGNGKYSVGERTQNPWRPGSDWFFTLESFKQGGTIEKIAERTLGMVKAHLSE